MNTRRTFVTASLLALSSAAFAGDPLVWDNGDADTLPLYAVFPSRIRAYEGNVSTDVALADDFMLIQDSFITRVQWTGVVPHALDGPVPPFVVKFYMSDPSGQVPFGAPGDAGEPVLASFFIPAAAVEVLPDANYPEFALHFAVDLPMPFIAAAGEHYWMSVQGYFELTETNSLTFGWMQSTSQQLNVLAGSSGGWHLSDDLGDLAFKLYGTPVPGPGALALLGVAALVKSRRRRR